MKTKILSTIILLTLNFSLLSSFSFAQWELQYPIPTDKSLEDVYFIDDFNGWAVGDNGTIIHTNDGGISWNFQSSGTLLRLRSVVFTDSQTGWIVGGETHPIPDEYIILHTIDGGNNWFEQDSDNTSCLRDVIFLDSENGWAVGDHNYIFHTNDGGNTWEQQDCDACKKLNAVYFVDSYHGWTVGGSIYNTTDGGQNSIEQPFDTTGFRLESVFFTDIENGWAVGNKWAGGGILLHTTDGGNNWVYELFTMSLYSVHFKDNENGLITGADGIILLTQDGGITWEQLDSGTDNSLFSVCFTSDGHGYAAGVWGTIVRSDDLITHTSICFSDKKLNLDVQCFPNPFSESTTLSYSLTKKSLVSIEIYNTNGQIVFIQENKVKSEGKHEVIIYSKGLPAGIYFCNLKTWEETLTTKMIKL